MHAKVYDRTVKSVVFGLWIKPQTNDFHEFVFIVLYFVAIGSSTADGGLPPIDNTWSDDTNAERQAQQHFWCGRKLEARPHSREQQLKTRECPLFVRLLCLFSVITVSFVSRWFLVHTLWLQSVFCSSHRLRHVSCARRVTLSSIPSSISFSFSSSSLVSSTFFCSSSSVR